MLENGAIAKYDLTITETQMSIESVQPGFSASSFAVFGNQHRGQF